MATREEHRFPPLPREQHSSVRQLPGVHELLSAALPPPPPAPLQTRDSYPSLHGPAWQNGNAPPPHQHGLSTPQYADVKSVDPVTPHPLAALHTSHHSFPPPAYSVPASAPRFDHRPSLFAPPAPPVTLDIRRDSARPGFGPTVVSPSDKSIRQQLFPGRGPCWVYSDGTTCPVSIDGEMVNPLWGTTKAGKARKRLAQACLSCREKKIRCEPQYPRCAQCEKAKRECVMPSAQNPSEDNIPPQSLQTLVPVSTVTHPRPQSPRPYKRRRSDEAPNGSSRSPPGTSPREPISLADQPIPSRETATDSAPQSRGSPYGAPSSVATPSLSLLPRPSDAIATGWHIDPYEEDADTTMHLLNVILMPAMTGFNYMLPRAAFKRWVVECRTKRPEETMILYTMLALGAAMSKNNSAFGQVCTHRATIAMERTIGIFNFMVAQARLNLGLSAAAQSQDEVASEYIAAAIHTIRMAGLTTEEGCAEEDPQLENGVFGMNAHQVTEAKRRTVWAAYVLEQVHTATRPVLASFPEGSIHLRHSCPEDIFERGLPSRASFFDSSLRSPLIHSLPDQTTTCPLAFITEISHLIGSHNAFAFARLDRKQHGSYAHDYADFLQIMEQRLATWQAAIPTNLRTTDGSFSPSANEHELALGISVSALYHMAVIQTTRFVKHAQLSRSLVAQNIARADASARELLRLAEQLCVYGQHLHEGQVLHHIIPPFVAPALALALDTACAGGQLRNLRQLLGQAMPACTVLDTLGYIWPSARVLYSAAERRIADLQEVERCGVAPAPGFVINRSAGCWRAAEPCWRRGRTAGKGGSADGDGVYGVDDEELFRALGR